MNTTIITKITQALSADQPDLSSHKISQKVETLSQDLMLLVRCAKTKCLITYTKAIELRGHGSPRNGSWLDEVFLYALTPFHLPDLTLLVVNESTGKPSPEAFEARRSKLSQVKIDDVQLEQRRCFWFDGYADLFGDIEDIPTQYQFVRISAPQPDKEREIARAVSNALARVAQYMKVKTTVGKEYPNSLSRIELTSLTNQLWDRQNGRCRSRVRRSIA